MKRFLTVAATMLALTGMGQVAMRKLEDLTNTNLVCVTDYGPQVVSLTARVTGIEGNTNDWSKTVLNLAALSNNVAGLSSRAAETNELFSAWFSGLQSRTSYWDTAYSWGDWSTAGLATTQQLIAAVAPLAAHTNRTDNPHGVTAAQIGALTDETDDAALAALAAYAAYWPPSATASGWFTFVTNSGAITITGYNTTGGTDVAIPDYINGWPVTAIGNDAFLTSSITTVGGAGNVVTLGASAFFLCDSLTSVSLPQAQTVGDSAFGSCSSLTSVSLPQAQTVGDLAFGYCGSLASVYFGGNAPATGTGTFEEITANQVTNYVTNPQATGWGSTFGGMPVVRPPLYAGQIYENGVGVATTQHVAEAIAGYLDKTPGVIEGSVYWDTTGGGLQIFDSWLDTPFVLLGPQIDHPEVATRKDYVDGLVSSSATNRPTFAEVHGIVYSNSVSQMTVWTNATGVCTNWARLEGGIWYTNAFGAGEPLPDGIVTNGMADATVGNVRLNGNIVTAYYGKFGYSLEDVNLSTIAPITGQGNAVFFRGYRDDWSENITRLILRGDGSVEIPYGKLVLGPADGHAIRSVGNDLVFDTYHASFGYSLGLRGNRGTTLGIESSNSQDLEFAAGGDRKMTLSGNGSLSVTGTNTAAVVRSTGGYIIGPTISGKQAHIFTDGTNCFFVNVNSVTNALTTN